MPLSPTFLFSQSNLQDYSDCKRRFYLKYLQKLAWPSIESEPIEETEHFRLQGEIFHKMVHQFFLGISSERLSSMVGDILLGTWWENFLANQDKLFQLNESLLFPEMTQTAVLNSHRLLAKYDLLISRKDGTCRIYDWKTYRKRPRRDHMEKKLQTRLYPFLYILARGKSFYQLPLAPEQLSMDYWYTNFPLQPERFPYSQAQYQKDLQFFSHLLSEIALAAESGNIEAFPLTENTDRCIFCIYRSLCNRGIRAGNLDETLADVDDESSHVEASSLESFDFDHISEIEF
jgi:CRISPR/Cas system-associated exonuclease Cas4 (RecB family)